MTTFDWALGLRLLGGFIALISFSVEDYRTRFYVLAAAYLLTLISWWMLYSLEKKRQ